jgi:hypothetical protein
MCGHYTLHAPAPKHDYVRWIKPFCRRCRATADTSNGIPDGKNVDVCANAQATYDILLNHMRNIV